MKENISTQFFLRYVPKDKTKKCATLFASKSKEDIFEHYITQSSENPSEDYRIDKVTTLTEVIAQTSDCRQSLFNF